MNPSPHKSTSIAAAVCAAALLSFLATGCATAPASPPGAAEVRSKLTELQNDPDLSRLAPIEIREAESAVAAAEQPLQKDSELGDHRVFMADRKVEIAIAKASTRYDESQRESLERERASARLAARTLEADRARTEAAASRDSAAAADSKAKAMQREIDMLQAKATDRGLVLTLGNVLFATGSSELKPGSVAGLDRLVAFLEQYPDRTAVIEGHTDDVGTAERNQALSLNRAQSVMAYLSRQGIPSRRITAIGLGETRPVADNDSAAGRQQNRRVEIIVENPVAPAVSSTSQRMPGNPLDPSSGK